MRCLLNVLNQKNTDIDLERDYHLMVTYFLSYLFPGAEAPFKDEEQLKILNSASVYELKSL